MAGENFLFLAEGIHDAPKVEEAKKAEAPASVKKAEAPAKAPIKSEKPDTSSEGSK